MNYGRLGIIVLMVGLFCGAMWVSGCGGSSGPSEPLLSDETGTLTVEIQLPQPGGEGRYIPPTTQSFKVSVFAEGNFSTVQAEVVTNTSVAVLSNVVAGPKDVRVWAYDGLAGAGNSVAYGVQQVRILGGRNNTANVPIQAGRLILISTADGDNELYRVTPDGRYATQLTTNTFPDIHPAPSPDGNKIAYASKPGADYEIRIMNNAAGTPAIVTFANKTGDDLYPTWSPDSTTIAWVNNNAGVYTIYRKNVNGTGEISIGLGASLILGLDWSPDGSRIAFSRWDATDGDWEIAVMWSNLTSASNITNNLSTEIYPVWRESGGWESIFCSSMDSAGNYQLAEVTGGLVPGGSAYVYKITSEPWNHYLWGISPDDELLACSANPPWIGNTDIYYYTLTGGLYRIRVTYHGSSSNTYEQPCFLPPTSGSGSVGPY